MLYFVRLDARQPDGMTFSEFREVWHRNAVAMQGTHDEGTIEGYKVVGRRTILAIAEFPDNDALDAALAALPIVEEIGGAVEIEVTPVRPCDDTLAARPKAARHPDAEADVNGQSGLHGTPEMAGGRSLG